MCSQEQSAEPSKVNVALANEVRSDLVEDGTVATSAASGVATSDEGPVNEEKSPDATVSKNVPTGDHPPAADDADSKPRAAADSANEDAPCQKAVPHSDPGAAKADPVQVMKSKEPDQQQAAVQAKRNEEIHTDSSDKRNTGQPSSPPGKEPPASVKSTSLPDVDSNSSAADVGPGFLKHREIGGADRSQTKGPEAIPERLGAKVIDLSKQAAATSVAVSNKLSESSRPNPSESARMPAPQKTESSEDLRSKDAKPRPDVAATVLSSVLSDPKLDSGSTPVIPKPSVIHNSSAATGEHTL